MPTSGYEQRSYQAEPTASALRPVRADTDIPEYKFPKPRHYVGLLEWDGERDQQGPICHSV